MSTSTASSHNQPHNLLVILCDQLRRDALGCYGDANVSTPHIDALAARGVKFSNMCSTYPICVPFRFSLMTGQYAHTRMVPGINWRMSPAERTLADEFNETGLETLYVGKWHLYGDRMQLPGYSAIHQGRKPVPRAYQGRWKHWRGFELRNQPNDTNYFVDDDPMPRPIKGYQTDGLFDIAMDDMRILTQQKKRFACVVSIEPPHPPFVAPQAYEDRWKDRDITLPANFYDGDDDELRKTLLKERRTYYAMIENIDDNMGRMAAFLDEQGLTKNTTIVFMADHGEMGGSHGLRHKQNPYEESAGVPLIIAGPGVKNSRASGADSSATIDDPMATEDLFPTLLGLMGQSPRDAMHGSDASPVVRGEKQTLGRDGVMLQFVAELRKGMLYNEKVWRAWRSKRYTYVVMGDHFGAKPYQLFDLQDDPFELNNLVNDPAHQEIAASHHKALRSRLVETEDDYALLPAFGCDGMHLYAERGPQPND